MKDFLTGTLGFFGGIIYYLFALLVTIIPFIMIGLPIWATFILLLIVQFFPLSSIVFWIWGIVCAIQGPQDIWAYIYYGLTVVVYIPFLFNIVLGIISDLTRS